MKFNGPKGDKEMTDRDAISSWVEGYIRAWNSNDPADIGRLFAENALYYTSPFEEPWRGRDNILAGWLERKDEPGTWEFDYDILAVENDIGVIRGLTHYKEAPPRTYSNIWVTQLNETGECVEFTEFWMKKK
jgi:hypothetical protein